MKWALWGIFVFSLACNSKQGAPKKSADAKPVTKPAPGAPMPSPAPLPGPVAPPASPAPIAGPMPAPGQNPAPASGPMPKPMAPMTSPTPMPGPALQTVSLESNWELCEAGPADEGFAYFKETLQLKNGRALLIRRPFTDSNCSKKPSEAAVSAYCNEAFAEYEDWLLFCEENEGGYTFGGSYERDAMKNSGTIDMEFAENVVYASFEFSATDLRVSDACDEDDVATKKCKALSGTSEANRSKSYEKKIEYKVRRSPVQDDR